MCANHRRGNHVDLKNRCARRQPRFPAPASTSLSANNSWRVRTGSALFEFFQAACSMNCACTLQGTPMQAPKWVRQDLDFWPTEWQGALLRGPSRGLPCGCGARSVPVPRRMHAAAVFWGRGGGDSKVLHRAQACKPHRRKELNVQVCGCRHKRWLLSPCILWERSRRNPDVLLGSQEDGSRGPGAQVGCGVEGPSDPQIAAEWDNDSASSSFACPSTTLLAEQRCDGAALAGQRDVFCEINSAGLANRCFLAWRVHAARRQTFFWDCCFKDGFARRLRSCK